MRRLIVMLWMLWMCGVCQGYGIGSYDIDRVVTFYCNTHSIATGAATDADAAPTYRVYEDGTYMTLTSSMTIMDSSNTDGAYYGQVTLSAANGFEYGKSYAIEIIAIVGGVTSQASREFQIGASVNVEYWIGTAITGALITSSDQVDAIWDADVNSVELAAIKAYVDDLETRLSAARAGYLDALNGHIAQTGDSYALANGASGFVAIKGDTASVLADTGAMDTSTELRTLLYGSDTPGATAAAQTTAQNDLDIITGASGVNLLAATQASIDAIEGDTGELQTNQGNWLTATGFATSIALATAQADLDDPNQYKATGFLTDKAGFSLAAGGLDAIPITAPAGVASDFREMIVQLWRRFFEKAVMTATTLTTYADDGATPITAQTISTVGSTQTQGAAE